MYFKLINRLKSKMNRLFRTILLYFVSLTIPIFAIGMITYIYSVNQFKNEYITNINMKLKTVSDDIDTYLKIVQETSMNFFYDKTVVKNFKPESQMTTLDRIEVIEIPTIIGRNVSAFNTLIHSSFVYNDDIYVYSNYGLNDYSVYFNKFFKYDLYDENFWKSMLETNISFEILSPSMVSDSTTSSTFSVIPVVHSTIVNGNKTVMVTNISSKAIYEDVKRIFNEDETEFVVLDLKGNVIANSDIKGYDINESYLAIANLKKENNSSKITYVNGRKSLVCHVTSERYAWKYMAIVPFSEFGKREKGILLLTAALCLLLPAIGVVFSFIFAHKIYNPIQKIKEIVTENQYILDHVGNEEIQMNELELINKNVRLMAEQGSKYKEDNESVCNDYLENSIIYMLNGNRIEKTEKIEYILKDKFNFFGGLYLCANILFEFKEAFYKDIQDTERLNVLNALKKIILDLMREHVSTYVVELKHNHYVCIVNINKEADIEKVKEGAQSIIKSFEYDSEYCRLSIGIGNIYKGLNKIHKSYNEAATAIINSNNDSDFQVTYTDDIEVTNRLQYTLANESIINNCLRLRNRDELKKEVCRICQNNMQTGNSFEYIQILFKGLFNTGIRYLAERGYSINGFISDRANFMSETIYNHFDYNKMIDSLMQFYDEILEITSDEKKLHSKDLASMITEYVKSNYHEDLFVEKIAENMGVSVKYVSKVFKEKSGINLTEFINTVRIEKAKELLSETDISIGEIEKRTGFFSRATFIRCFKKVEGITPSEYRLLKRN